MFGWVQVLRGLAAAMVVSVHYVAAQIGRGASAGAGLQEFGGSGVDIFFVISGFIMMVTQSDSARPSSAKDFLLRRTARIIPLYWALTALLAALVLVAGSAINTQISLPKFLMSMLFLPYGETAIDMSAMAHTAYVIPMSWTLTYEWYFYLVFAVTLALDLSPASRLKFMSVWFAACVAAGLAFRPAPLILQVITSPLVFEFLLGCSIALIYKRGHRLNGLQASLLALVAMLILSEIFHHTVFGRTLIWGLAAFALIAAATLYEGRISGLAPAVRPFTWLGDISYSLYLSHFFTVAFFVRLQKRFTLVGDGFGPLTLIAFATLALLVAAFCYRFIEQPAKRTFARKNPGADMPPPA